MTALALHRVRIEPTWKREAGPSASAAPTGPGAAASRRTPLTVHGGTITPAQADQMERHLEATKGARLAAAMAERGVTPEAYDFWFGGAT